ncbi:MAG: hypothetical protein WBA57_19735 [Elainellaceae cyanobacterium]
MQLNFLGRSDTGQNSAIETSQMNVAGKYRGIEVALRKGPHQAPSSGVSLQFKGQLYSR